MAGSVSTRQCIIQVFEILVLIVRIPETPRIGMPVLLFHCEKAIPGQWVRMPIFEAKCVSK
jgi:hypothetical protein